MDRAGGGATGAPPPQGLYRLLEDGNWDHALRLAAKLGFHKIVRWLCELPSEESVRPGSASNSALRQAARNGHVDVVRYLCGLPAGRGVDPATARNYAVRCAALHGHTAVVRLLCELPAWRGVDPAAFDNDSVQCAARRGHLAVVRYLCEEQHVNPAACDNEAVRKAAACGHLPVVRYLCEQAPEAHRVDPGAKDNYAVRKAAAHGYAGVVRYLCTLPVERGVDPAVRDNWPVRWAAWHGRTEVVRALCELPLGRGVDPAALDNDAVSKAAVRGHVDVLRYLCEAVPAARGVDPAASCAVVWAADRGQMGSVRYLCELPAARGVDPAANDNFALRSAARQGRVEMVRYLCELPPTRTRRAVCSTDASVLRVAWCAHREPVVGYLLRRAAREPVDTRRAVAGHVRHLLTKCAAWGNWARPAALCMVHLACTHAVVPEDAATWFPHPTAAQPLLTRLFQHAIALPSRDAFRAVRMVLDVTCGWSGPGGPGGGGGRPSPSSMAAAAAAAAVTQLLQAVWPRRGASALAALPPPALRRMWRLLRDACALYIPRGQPLTTGARAAILATMRPWLACLPTTMWSAELAHLVTEMRCPQRMDLLLLRQLRDTGRAVALTRRSDLARW